MPNKVYNSLHNLNMVFLNGGKIFILVIQISQAVCSNINYNKYLNYSECTCVKLNNLEWVAKVLGQGCPICILLATLGIVNSQKLH